MGRADRGVSTAVTYALSLTIVTLLVSGIFLGMGDFVQGQQERAIRSEFSVIGNRIAADLAATDRMILAADGSASVRLRTSLPSHVAGKNYQVNVSNPGAGDTVFVNLTTRRPDVSLSVEVKNETAVAETSVSGGDVEFGYDGTKVVMRRA